MAKKDVILEKLPLDSFSWSRWRRFNLFAMIGIACRNGDIVFSKSKLRKYAVGYISGENVCRPKENTMAVMWLEDSGYSWCHLTLDEFYKLFGEQQ